MTNRVNVYIDYQNVYRCARRAFHDEAAPSHDGQISPARLRIWIGTHFNSSEVTVKVFRGVPNSARDPRGSSAATRQLNAWRSSENVVPVTRGLRYSSNQPPREKGIDVELALAMVVDAYEDQADTFALFSADTDLIPAVERVHGLGKQVYTLGWRGLVQQPQVLRVPNVRYTLLDSVAYGEVNDLTVYLSQS